MHSVNYNAGCKIKALRAKTNTYIKTPVRGEEPVFSISGRPDHVNSAKWEIIAAAEHFTQIRDSRLGASSDSAMGSGSDKVTIYVRVPYRVVGLVVGPRGATVKRIQVMTRTSIVTPSRDKEPCFEVKGTLENVERARKEIESYISLRTGSKCNAEKDCSDMGSFSPVISSSSSSCSSPPSSADMLAQQMQQCKIADVRSTANTHRDFGTKVATGTYLREQDVTPQWTPPTIFSGTRFTPPDTSYQPISAPLLTQERVFDFSAIGGTGGKPQPLSPTGSYESNSSDGLGAASPKQSPLVAKRAGRSSCWNCKLGEDLATLMPCGHSVFCQTCAHFIACSSGSCPLCKAQVTNIMHM